MVNILKNLFKELFNDEIICVQIRYKEFEVDSIYKGDYDLFVPEYQLNKFLKKVFEVLSKNCINFSINKKKFGKTQIFIYENDDMDNFVQFEIWTHLELKDPFNKASKYIYYNTIKDFIKKDENKFIFPIEIESLYYLSHLFTKSKTLSNEEVQARINYYSNQLEKINNNKYMKYFDDLYTNIVSIKEIAHLANLELIKLGFANTSSQNILKQFSTKIKIQINRIYCSLLKKNKLIPILGPDGVGKTTFIDYLINQNKKRYKYYRFKKLFRKSLIYKVSYSCYLKKISKNHLKSLEKNQIDDLIGKNVFFSALSHYPVLLLTSLLGRKVILSDRFFHDYFISFMRFENLKARLNYKLKPYFSLLPRTYYLIHLDAPTDIILSRKQELSYDNIDNYRSLIFELYLKKSSVEYFYLNTNNDIQKLCSVFIKNN